MAGEEDFQKVIEKANQPEQLQQTRNEMIVLFEKDDWRLTEKAEADGRKILLIKGYKQATQWGICEYILGLLKSGFPLRAIGMGEPPGSRGIAHIMKNADENGLYVKLKVEDAMVWVLSFHY